MENLAALRAEIDGIDKSMLDLLKARAEVVNRVAKEKSKSNLCVRPGREVTMMKGLLPRIGTDISRAFVWRLWREIISNSVFTENPFVVYSHHSLWDICRDHFGSRVPVHLVKTPKQAIEQAAKDANSLAVVPALSVKSRANWWSFLGQTDLTIYAFLPRLPGGNARGSLEGALAVAHIRPEDTGDDVSFVASKVPSDVSAASLNRMLAQPQNASQIWLSLHNLNNEKYLLSCIKGHNSCDNALALHPSIPILSSSYLGGYAVPPALT